MSAAALYRIIRPMRYFDVPEANRLVPYLDKTFRQIRGWIEEARKLSEQVDRAKETARADELRAEREQSVTRIREELQRLEEMGIEVKSVEGLVDFRAIMSGRQVYLCWRFGEESVTHWHELDTGFAGRQPIQDVGAFEPSYLS